MNRLMTTVMALTALILTQTVCAQVKATDESDRFFSQVKIPELRITLSDEELKKLTSDPRKYVRCTIIENKTTTYRDVAIKLKGAAGSFREFDDRPALTLNSSKFQKGQSFHAMNKFHLNNSVQDETYTHEWLCEQLFRAAGVPATRVTHARVWLNERDVGLYVLKEGFDQTFLKRHFEDPKGNLYDGGFVQDIDQDLEKDAGGGPDDHSDLKTLVEACREPNLAERWKQIDKAIDIDAFITFMAMELMTGHWDGYTQNCNNYRIYFDPTTKKARFLPHGMDQMFGDPSASILDFPAPIVSSAVMQNTEWRAKYRQRVTQLLPLFFPPGKLEKQVDLLRKRLRPVLVAIDPQLARDHAEHVRELKERLTARARNLKEQSERPDPQPEEFDENGMRQIDDWYAVSESDDAVIEEADSPDGTKALSILCGPSGQCVASWRRKILLSRGAYCLHANAMTKNVTATQDEKGSAAGIRISGSTRMNSLDGTSQEWKSLEFEFTIEEEKREVELIAELRTSIGQVWFDPQSLNLVRREVDQQK